MSTLRQHRKEAGLKQSEVASALEVTRVTYTQIENGRRRVRASEVHILARVLGTSAEDVLAAVEEGK